MPERQPENNGLIFGNGLEKEYKASFPGVSSEWRYNPHTDNYDLVEAFSTQGNITESPVQKVPSSLTGPIKKELVVSH